MPTKQLMQHCNYCNRPTLHIQQTPNHLLHLVLCLCTFGLWLIVWFFTKSSDPICTVCGHTQKTAKKAIKQVQNHTVTPSYTNPNYTPSKSYQPILSEKSHQPTNANMVWGLIIFLCIAAFMLTSNDNSSHSNNGIQQEKPPITTSSSTVAERQKYLDAFLKNPNDVLERLNAAIKNREWIKATTIAEYYLPTKHPEIVRLHTVATTRKEVPINGNASPEALKTPIKAPLSQIPPKSACSFLESLGFKTQGWGELADGSYGCPSEEIELGRENPLYYKNNIRYYVTSDGNRITELKIFLNISDLSQSEAAKQVLLKSTLLLLKKLSIKNMPPSVEKAIKNGETIKITSQDFNISVQKMNWDNNKNYSIKVSIN